MKNETFEKATELKRDIKNLEMVVEESEKDSHWIRVITPRTLARDIYYSVRFQHELKEWLKTNIEEYQKEFENLN